MLLKKIFLICLMVCAALFVLYWLWQIARCLTRKDFTPLDRLVWTFALLIPVVGLILYRGIGGRLYARKPQKIIVSPDFE